MAMYNDKVIAHFTNPHNVGELLDPDGEGTYGSPVCGDMMKISIRVENEVIVDAKFKTFGCGSAIASSSVATDMIIGKSIDEALEITNQDVLDELGGLPPIKTHCSVLADHAIRSAIYDYAKRSGRYYAGLEGFDPNADEDDQDHGCDMEEK
ncbi:MAG: iron-sulfur cluster assembly scaffold protein [Clostridiales Family XIII bacterium]|jgi:nitrogen fixation NifU-like protein|nr:iron-sulfur cluster assembly scaffold protein [Clostridiales Family XIII bacterium]